MIGGYQAQGAVVAGFLDGNDGLLMHPALQLGDLTVFSRTMGDEITVLSHWGI